MKPNISNFTNNKPLWFAISSSIFAFLFFCYLSNRIDFHPDEAVYYDAIGVNLNNDAGLFYHIIYSSFLDLYNGVAGARFASSFLGAFSLFCLIRVFSRYFGTKRALLFLVLTFLISYQAVFVFDRVRPEAAWWALSCWLILILAKNYLKNSDLFITAFCLMLLPMNHRLSWFPSFFAIGYLFLFVRPQIGNKKFLLVSSSFVLGVLLNIALRAVWLKKPIISAFHQALHGVSSDRQDIKSFFRLVFYDAPFFLNDTALNSNFYKIVLHRDAYWASHSFVQNTLLITMFFLPFMGRNGKERYLFSFPLFAFIGFFASGYYNPTYAAGFSLVCVLICCFIYHNHSGALKYFALIISAISIFNGLSFISTRILNHGSATYFSEELKIEALIKNNPKIKNIALPERFQVATMPFGVHRIINYKSVNSGDIDLMVVDNYDQLMYGFVPDFENRKLELSHLMSNMCLLEKNVLPVYLKDSLLPVNNDSFSGKLSPVGSWFFRNSVTYTMYVFKKC